MALWVKKVVFEPGIQCSLERQHLHGLPIQLFVSLPQEVPFEEAARPVQQQALEVVAAVVVARDTLAVEVEPLFVAVAASVSCWSGLSLPVAV